ncbi:phage portal protein [Pseudobutyrivibrio sp.]|uniref:phage portal protein n=1 Tax=Pseudobutyrivibrio sp. TaxID=2014367 RepID=UPI0025F28DF8|nr:phage portal protein [Pseudobutyrivibrio sp.]
MGYLSDMFQLRNTKKSLELAKAENQLAKTRANTAMLNAQRDAVERFVNSGYSHGGASRGATWAEQYHSESLSPKSDIEENRKLLRERTRDLAMNAPIATAAINSTRTNVIGMGLKPKPKIDYEFLGMSREDATKLQSQIKKEFAVWAASTLCDVCDLNNFYALQQIAFSDWLKNGEEFALIQYGEATTYMPYSLRLRLVSADRISTPGNNTGEYDGFDKIEKNGNTIMNGVEIDKNGKVVAYHICSEFPGEFSRKSPKWKRIEKRGKKTGNPNILHVFNAEIAEQYRGVPFLAPVIQSIKQLTRYTEAEIMAAVINSMFALFVSTETGNDIDGFGGVDDDDDFLTMAPDKEDEIRLGSGTINFLKSGEKVEAVESKHPSQNYDSFVSAFAMMIGAALEISPEVLMKKFSNNFSASKGALNETWKAFSMRRKWFVDDFCQQVYEIWFAEAVSLGRIKAPGFFTDPLIKKAYTNATWTGPAQGVLNPSQEAEAAIKRIAHGLSTHEDECAAMNGSDYEDNVRTLEIENEKLAQANRPLMEEVTDEEN